MNFVSRVVDLLLYSDINQYVYSLVIDHATCFQPDILSYPTCSLVSSPPPLLIISICTGSDDSCGGGLGKYSSPNRSVFLK